MCAALLTAHSRHIDKGEIEAGSVQAKAAADTAEAIANKAKIIADGTKAIADAVKAIADGVKATADAAEAIADRAEAIALKPAAIADRAGTIPDTAKVIADKAQTAYYATRYENGKGEQGARTRFYPHWDRPALCFERKNAVNLKRYAAYSYSLLCLCYNGIINLIRGCDAKARLCFFWKNMEDFYRKYGHKYLAIKNRKILGNYDSFDKALNETLKTELLGIFLIQECFEKKEPPGTYPGCLIFLIQECFEKKEQSIN